METMTSKAPKIQTPEQIARLEKQRIARIEGDIALAEVDRQSIAIRENMERLRALRLAKEAQGALHPPAVIPKKKKVVAKKKLPDVAESGVEAVGEG